MLKPGHFVHFATLDVEPGWEQEFARWFSEEESQRSTKAGDRVEVQRYQAVRGTPKDMLLYDLASPGPFPAATQIGLEESAWTARLGPHVSTQHALYEQIFPEAGIFQGVEWQAGNTRVGGLRVTRVDCKPEQTEDVNAWYSTEHIPLLSRCPGAIGGRRFKAVTGAPMYMTIIYLTEPGALQDPAWAKVSTTHWTVRLRDAFTTRWSAIYQTG